MWLCYEKISEQYTVSPLQWRGSKKADISGQTELHCRTTSRWVDSFCYTTHCYSGFPFIYLAVLALKNICATAIFHLCLFANIRHVYGIPLAQTESSTENLSCSRIYRVLWRSFSEDCSDLRLQGTQSAQGHRLKFWSWPWVCFYMFLSAVGFFLGFFLLPSSFEVANVRWSCFLQSLSVVPEIARLTTEKEVQTKLKRPKKPSTNKPNKTPKFWDSDVSYNSSCGAGSIFKKIFWESSSFAQWSL